ncbi:hypothetical protein SQ11_15835, partial [Nitrosospira sp. NpAV]
RKIKILVSVGQIILGLPEQLMLDMLSKGTRREQWRFGLRDSLREWLKDDLILRWLTENCP